MELIHFWDVHGDIRHLEKHRILHLTLNLVHGDIRHLEKVLEKQSDQLLVHGDIRHLEM